MSGEVFRLKTLIEIHIGEERVLRDNLIQDIEVKGQFVDAVHALEHFAAQRTLDLVVSQEERETPRAERMATTYDDSWDAGTNVVLQPAKVAVIEPSRLVI